MKFGFVLIALLLVFAVLLVGCSEKSETVTTSSQQQANQQQEEVYSPQSVPLENANLDDVRALQITPSGDSQCFLSPCDCNCYVIKNVPLHAKKPMCATNCRQEYGISGCVFGGVTCSAIQT